MALKSEDKLGGTEGFIGSRKAGYSIGICLVPWKWEHRVRQQVVCYRARDETWRVDLEESSESEDLKLPTCTAAGQLASLAGIAGIPGVGRRLEENVCMIHWKWGEKGG